MRYLQIIIYLFIYLFYYKAWRVLSYYTILLVVKSGQLIANQIWEFCYGYD